MSIPFEGIRRLLPFPTQIVAGLNHNHIMSIYAYDIETPTRTISEGDNLCGRKSLKFFREATTNCPGCSAIGENLALRNPITARSIELLAPAISTRNRHTVENDRKTALIKRINRKLASQFKKVRINRFGETYIVHTTYAYVICTGVNLTELACSLGVAVASRDINATDCASIGNLTDLAKAEVAPGKSRYFTHLIFSHVTSKN